MRVWSMSVGGEPIPRLSRGARVLVPRDITCRIQTLAAPEADATARRPSGGATERAMLRVGLRALYQNLSLRIDSVRFAQFRDIAFVDLRGQYRFIFAAQGD